MSVAELNTGLDVPGEMDDFFEGPEKTLMVEFKPAKLGGSLRSKPQEVWSEVLRESGVTILSKLCPFEPTKDKVSRANHDCTAYLLSESSLFVYDTRVVLKTCGRTSPLRALPAILGLSKTKDEQSVLTVAYSRPTLFRFAEQPAPHQSFDQEVAFLQRFFPAGEGYSLFSKKRGVDVFLANNAPATHFSTWVQAEVYVTELDDQAMDTFSKSSHKRLGQFWDRVTKPTPSSKTKPYLDEFYFEPYGYSANVLQRGFYTTTHATPQPECSYFSAATNAPLTNDELGDFLQAATSLGAGKQVDVFLLTCQPDLALLQPKKPAGMMRTSQTCLEGDDFSLQHCSFTTVSAAPAVGPCVQERRGVVQTAREALAAQPHGFDRPIMLVDTHQLKAKLQEWTSLLPRIKPCYAVKCNPAPGVVNQLVRLQAQPGFDCASEAEMRLVTSLGANAEDIVYSNPCKQVSSIAYAKEIGVKRVVFDNSGELAKLAAEYPAAELMIRVQTDDTDSQCPMSMKFGCPVAQCASLLEEAKARGQTVVGIMFHVGSGCSRRGAFTDALGRAKQVAETGRALGFPIRILDIGGGFPGSDHGVPVTFREMAEEINEGLAGFDDSFTVIAEPGRFFVHSAGTLLCQVMAKAPMAPKEGSVEHPGFRYYLNDGLYGSFNCFVYDHAELTLGPLSLNEEGTALKSEGGLESVFFGPTCDGFDALFKQDMGRELEIGEWLLFPAFGAYTNAAATSFNGFALPLVHLF